MTAGPAREVGRTPGSGGLPVALLRRIASQPAAPPAGERCEMCGEPIPEAHQHVVDVESHAMMCTCRPCYLLFTDSTAHLRYRSVPDRYLSFPAFELGAGPVGRAGNSGRLAFFFAAPHWTGRSPLPGPAGATESELPLDAWGAVLARNPALAVAAPDTEALLIRGPGRSARRPTAIWCRWTPAMNSWASFAASRRASTASRKPRPAHRLL